MDLMTILEAITDLGDVEDKEAQRVRLRLKERVLDKAKKDIDDLVTIGKFIGFDDIQRRIQEASKLIEDIRARE